MIRGGVVCAAAGRCARTAGADQRGYGDRGQGGQRPLSVRGHTSQSRHAGVAGAYELVERRGDGSLVLRPQHERLSEVLRETEGHVFRDEEFAVHLERVAASEDDLASDASA